MTDIAADFLARIFLYPSDKGGRRTPFEVERYGCPCKFHERDITAWDCFILVGGQRFAPGETKQFRVKFLTPEVAPLFRVVERFHLWKGKIIGEVTSRIE